VSENVGPELNGGAASPWANRRGRWNGCLASIARSWAAFPAKRCIGTQVAWILHHHNASRLTMSLSFCGGEVQ
jgi:hypothetical protein